MNLKFEDVLDLNKIDTDAVNELFLGWFYEKDSLHKLYPDYCVAVSGKDGQEFLPSDPDVYFLLNDLIFGAIINSGALYMIKDGENPIGFISLIKNNLTIFISSNYRNKGYAYNAIKDILPMLSKRSNKYKDDPFTIMFLSENIASRKLFEKLYGTEVMEEFFCRTLNDPFGRKVELYKFPKHKFTEFK